MKLRHEPKSSIHRQDGRITHVGLTELNNMIDSAVVEALLNRTDYSPGWGRETVREIVDKLQKIPLDFGNFRMPPPEVTSVSYSDEHGYVVHVAQNLPIPYHKGDVVTDMQGETFKCEGITGPVGSPGAPGQPGIPAVYPTPTFLRSSSTKPLLYSVDVYRSLKESQFVAISSFPIVEILKGTRIKPYAVGTTVQEAEDKLAQSIRGWTGRKEIGIINEHLHINKYVCVHCSNPTGYATKQDLIDHIGLCHNGNISVEKYTNPTAAGVWLKLP